MQTYSHFLVTAAVGQALQRRMLVRMKALLAGSVLPDVPLILITLGYFAYRRWFDPFAPGEFLYGARYDELYFHNPFWIASHNLFHAPILIALLLAVGYRAWRLGRSWGATLAWFALACAFHTVIDVFTHRGDGPLLLFPLDWHLRFDSPISYWNPRYHGATFATIEHLLDLGIAAYFLILWVRRRRKAPPSPAAPHRGILGHAGGRYDDDTV